MKLICHPLDGHRPSIRPAPKARDWMDATPDRFAYRCLPLDIANACGWEVLAPVGFEAVWDGGGGKQAIGIACDGPASQGPVSHFGSGILTFHLNALFRTEPDVQLLVCGPINRPKDGIAALTGVIETDWAPYGFTMNWAFTRAGIPVRFAEGEPFCHLLPLRLDLLEAAEPEFRSLDSDPVLAAEHAAWSESRRAFLAELPISGSAANRDGWQRGYFQGLRPDGQRGTPAHRTKLQLRPFRGAGDQSGDTR